MPRTVLGWRCRWGPGRSLPTSYTSPRATNKPLIVFPIHTDRGHHCLSGFTPCLSRGPWFTPFWKLFIQFCKFHTLCGFLNTTRPISHEQQKNFFHVFVRMLYIHIVTDYFLNLFIPYSIPLKIQEYFHSELADNVETYWMWRRSGSLLYSMCSFFSSSSYKKKTPDCPLTCTHLLFVYLQNSTGHLLALNGASSGP